MAPLRSLIPHPIALCLLIAVSTLVPTAATATQNPTVLTGNISGARFEIAVPHPWNGTLLLYSHGYVPVGQPNDATACPFPALRAWLMNHGYAAAGSSYSQTGWAVKQALHDQTALLDYFTARFGTPKRTIAWGGSEGSLVSAGLVQRYPGRFAGAIPIAGPLEGSVRAWNTALDFAFAFKTLLAPRSGLQVVHIAQPADNYMQALTVLNSAEKTATGRARIALAAALYDVPGWYDPTRPAPGHTAYAAQLSGQELWLSNYVLGFAFAYRADIERRAGGNPSWNTGVNYATQLNRSVAREEVKALYARAKLSLTKDLQTLARAPRISRDAAAVHYLAQNITFNGHITRPVLTLHTTADGLVPAEAERAFQQTVRESGHQGLLRQLYVRRAGHGNITPAELIAILQVLNRRLDTGRWPATDPTTMNRASADLGTSVNRAENWPGSPAAPAAFTRYVPGVFLR